MCRVNKMDGCACALCIRYSLVIVTCEYSTITICSREAGVVRLVIYFHCYSEVQYNMHNDIVPTYKLPTSFYS